VITPESQAESVAYIVNVIRHERDATIETLRAERDKLRRAAREAARKGEVEVMR
jgi:hypothetical protein